MEGLWIIKILKICVKKFFIFVKFLKILKIRDFCLFVLNVHKENMFTIEIEDGREDP